MGAEKYLLDNRAAEAGGRFGALSVIFDPVTFPTRRRPGNRTRLAMLGGRGWRTVGS